MQILTNRDSKLLSVGPYLIPILISALAGFVHLWDVTGFPAIHPDEGTYMRRAMYTLEGLGIHDPASQFDHSQLSTSSYDHPYFGHLLLAGIFTITGYPDSSLPSKVDANSIEMLYSVPRIIIGLLAVADTFLIYKITERRYSRKVAIIAAILFAVMPIGWLLRRIVLDSISLPLILTSVLFALNRCRTKKSDNYTKGNEFKSSSNTNSQNNFSLILLSGIFLGLAIFTKVPAFTMIPLVGFLIFTNSKGTKRWKRLALWFIPVISIPLIWPAFAISVGEFDDWLDGVFWQGTQRQTEGKTVEDLIQAFLSIDPVLLALGIAGFAFTIIRRDIFCILWVAPYIVFLIAVGWTTHFHWIQVLPVFCIAGAVLLRDLSGMKIIRKRTKAARVLSFSLVPATVIFGLVSTLVIITTDIARPQYDAAAFVVRDVQDNTIEKRNSIGAYNSSAFNADRANNDITIISSPAFSWVLKYVFDMPHVFSHVRDSSEPLVTERVLLVIDATYRHVLSADRGEDPKVIESLKNIEHDSQTIAKFRDDASSYNQKIYPYGSIKDGQTGARRGGIEVTANY